MARGATRMQPDLVERQQALLAVSEALEGASDGVGRTLLVEGAPGLGKTEIAAAAAGRATDLGLRVRRARGGELEQSLAWGIARELLAQPARGLERQAAAWLAPLGLGPGRLDDSVAIAHGLTELCAELAADRALALVVDDAHWGDPLSVGWLSFLAPRVEEMAVALIVTARPEDPRRPRELGTLAAREGVRVVRLTPLSDQGAALLVRRSIPDAEEELCHQCRQATGGNPFLLAELARELSARPDGASASDVHRLTIDRIDRVVGRRLAAVGDEGSRFARAVAILGSGARAGDVAAVAGLDHGEALRIADALRAAHVLGDEQDGTLAFIHPLVRSSVEHSVAPGERSLLHLEAARHRDQGGTEIERVGLHLMAVEPGADPWVRTCLIRAGDAALDAGAPRNAAELYERAAAERAGGRDPKLLYKLGGALSRVDPAAAAAPFQAAMEASEDLLERARVAIDLARVLQSARRSTESVPILEGLAEELRLAAAPRSLQLRVEAELLAQSYFRAETRRLRRSRLPQITAGFTGEVEEEILIVVQQAVEAINSGTAIQARELAERAWHGGQLERLCGSITTPAVLWIPYIRLYVDDYDWTISLMLDWIERARAAGSATLTCIANDILSEAQWRAGALRDAHASAHTAWEIAREAGSSFPGWSIALAALAQALLAIGQATEARDLLHSNGWMDGPPPNAMLMPLPRAVRAETLIATGEREHGVAELIATAEWVEEQGEPSPGAWRFHAALVDGLLALGRVDEAGDAARGWLRRTRRFGTRSMVGMAERSLGLCTRGEKQLDWLVRAERTLAATPARSEHARALLELGAALRRSRQRAASREPLRQALDLATRCGALPLAERARTELLASGGRPRRAALSGPDSLTASERRIAQMAAGGLTNRDIAAALFISRKTVERHLGNVYLKLGTSDRTQLAGALG